MWCARASRGETGRSKPHPVLWTGWGLGVLALLAAAPELVAQATPAGTQIINSAQVTYQAQNGLTFTVVSNAEVMVVGQVGGVDVDPPGVSVADPGTTATFVHTLKNVGNGTDSFTVVARSQAGWPVRIYRDANGDGTLDPGDPLVSGPIVLGMGSLANLLLATDVPPLASLRGTTDTIHLVGTSLFDRAVGDSLIDQLQIRSVGILVTLTKSVDRSSATLGDILTYTVTYVATGASSATNFQLLDPIPFGATYLPGTIRLNGAPLTDAGSRQRARGGGTGVTGRHGPGTSGSRCRRRGRRRHLRRSQQPSRDRSGDHCRRRHRLPDVPGPCRPVTPVPPPRARCRLPAPGSCLAPCCWHRRS
jgi:uncharacterized repeat protein (TIGR01451 family)